MKTAGLIIAVLGAAWALLGLTGVFFDIVVNPRSDWSFLGLLFHGMIFVGPGAVLCGFGLFVRKAGGA